MKSYLYIAKVRVRILEIAHAKTHTCVCVCDLNFGKTHTCVRCACGRKSSVRMCVRARQKIVATHRLLFLIEKFDKKSFYLLFVSQNTTSLYKAKYKALSDQGINLYLGEKH